MSGNQRQWWGFGFVLRNSLFACGLLILNSALFISVYASFVSAGPVWLKEPKVTQLALFVGPVLLLVAEWWILDRFFGPK